MAYAIQSIVQASDTIVSACTLYGGTYNLFAHTLLQYGISLRFADLRNPAAFEPLIDVPTKAILAASVGNPLGNISDITTLAEIAHHAPCEAVRAAHRDGQADLMQRRAPSLASDAAAQSLNRPTRANAIAAFLKIA